jgi:putative membrane protein
VAVNTALVLVGSLFVFVAAIVHLGIFFLESVLWTRPAVQRRFGVTSTADGEVLRTLMFNQGFYNVFLALGAGVGLVLYGTGASFEGGIAVALFALLSMLLASLVLIVSDRKLWRAALIQGGPPLLGIVLLGVALATA